MVKKSPGRKPKQTLPGQQCIDLRWLRKGSNSASSSVSQSNTSPSNASPSNTLHSNTSSGTAESRFNTISNVIQNDNDNVPFDSAVENEDQTHSSDMQTLSDFMHEVELGDRNQNAEEHERNDDCETDMQDTGALTEQEELDRYGPESLDNEGIVASYLRKVRDEKIKGIAKYYRQKNKFWIEPDPVFHCLDGRPLDSTVLYYPRIFVWLPDLLVPEKLCCPHCNAILHKDGLSTDPPARRVVDIDSCFYILSQRYRCSKCPKSFSAHEEKILSSLPFHIQSIFPAYLTHKSGISKALFDLMRPCYQNALGPERLHNLLYELHTLKHSRLELDYLNTIAIRLSNPQIQDNFASNLSHIPFSTFDDPKGYAGFVPSATYLRLVYTSLIDQLRPLIDKEMMVLDGIILKGDHTFKIIKHMAKIGGEPTFYAVYTVCNEYEEIRLQLLVPTKKLSHLKASLQEMLRSYHIYNHKEPEIFYTDNVVGDKSFLEETMPSLKRGFGPTASEATTDQFEQGTRPSNPGYLTIPDDVTKLFIGCVADANCYIDSLLNRTRDGSSITIGFDAEWNYSRTSQGKIPIVQIAFEETVTILPLHMYGLVPQKLAELLQSDYVAKVGRNICGDLGKIERDYGITTNQETVIELGRFSKEKSKHIHTASASLSTICAAVLGASLYKDDDVRSSDWEALVLSISQLHYAALDAWASLKIYQTLINSNEAQEHRPQPYSCYRPVKAYDDIYMRQRRIGQPPTFKTGGFFIET